MKSYLKTVRTAAFTAAMASLTLFSCQKQESVTPKTTEAGAEVANTEVSSASFTFDNNGKQVLLSDWRKQIAKQSANARTTQVQSGKMPVSRELVEQYQDEYGSSYSNATTYSKARFSSLFGRTTSHLDGVSFGQHQFGSGHNASTNVGWSADVNYSFTPYGSEYETQGTWQTVHTQYVSASPSASNTITVGHSPYTDSYTKNSWLKKTDTHGVDVGFTATIGFTAISNLAFTVNYSFSRARETMNGESQSSSHTPAVMSPLTVPAGYRCQLQLRRQTITRTQKYRVKTWFTGYVGGNYSKRVDGAYFWAKAAGSFFSETNNKYQEAEQSETYPAYMFRLANCSRL